MQDKQKLIELIEKYKTGTISAEEQALLDAWYNQVAAEMITRAAIHWKRFWRYCSFQE